MSSRASGRCWKMGVQFTFLPLTGSIFDRFSTRSWSQSHFVKKQVRNAHPVPPALSRGIHKSRSPCLNKGCLSRGCSGRRGRGSCLGFGHARHDILEILFQISKGLIFSLGLSSSGRRLQALVNGGRVGERGPDVTAGRDGILKNKNNSKICRSFYKEIRLNSSLFDQLVCLEMNLRKFFFFENQDNKGNFLNKFLFLVGLNFYQILLLTLGRLSEFKIQY